VEPLQLLLVVIGLVTACSGVYLLFDSRNKSASARGPYVPIAIAFIGFMIAYRAYVEYGSLDTMDMVIMFLFLFALMGLLGIQFFVIDRHRGDKQDR
jgi:hypothetical protein